MIYVKVFGSDGSVIAAEELKSPVYICYQSVNKIAVRCSKAKAQGVLSADASQIYQFAGSPTMPGEYLKAEEISAADYEQLLGELEIPETPPTSDTEVEESPGPGVMTATEMRAKLIELTEQVEFLGDCLVEMSEVVYE